MSLNGCKYEWKKILENLAVVISQHSSQSVYSVPQSNMTGEQLIHATCTCNVRVMVLVCQYTPFRISTCETFLCINIIDIEPNCSWICRLFPSTRSFVWNVNKLTYKRQTHSERNISIAYEFQTYKSYTSPFTGSIDIDNCLSNILAMSVLNVDYSRSASCELTFGGVRVDHIFSCVCVCVCVLSYYVYLRSELRVVMSVTISA